jgi:hypothetical protein
MFRSSFVKSFMRAAIATGVLLASAGLAAAQAPPVAQGQGPDLATVLHLRPDQLTAYHALEAADRESPTVMAQLQAKSQRVAAESLPQRLDFEAEVMDMRVAHAHRVWAAMRKFYAVLTPAQQHTFDQVTAPHPQQGAPQR